MDDVLPLINSNVVSLWSHAWNKGTTDTARSALCIDLYLDIEGGCMLRTHLHDIRYDFIFLMVNFLFISCNIPAAPGNVVRITISYSRACLS